jgi:hypothetical protein
MGGRNPFSEIQTYNVECYGKRCPVRREAPSQSYRMALQGTRLINGATGGPRENNFMPAAALESEPQRHASSHRGRSILIGQETHEWPQKITSTL